MGIEREILFPFNDQTKIMSPESFIQNMLWDSLDARLICVGEDYRFGCKRAGDVAMLERACKKHGCALRVFPKRKDEQGVISSTRIRELVRLGQMQEASKLLGRNFFYLGTVKHGQALGRTIQMPTINILPPAEKVLPPLGVYTSVVTVDGRRFGAVSNLGKKPTVGGKAISLESFLFDFDHIELRVFVFDDFYTRSFFDVSVKGYGIELSVADGYFPGGPEYGCRESFFSDIFL